MRYRSVRQPHINDNNSCCLYIITNSRNKKETGILPPNKIGELPPPKKNLRYKLESIIHNNLADYCQFISEI